MVVSSSVGIFETPEALQKQMERALGYTVEWRAAAKVKTRLVCYESTEKPGEFKWKCGEEESPIADVSNNCSSDAHVNQGIEGGQRHRLTR